MNELRQYFVTFHLLLFTKWLKDDLPGFVEAAALALV